MSDYFISIPGIIDSSGLRFYYTNKLREYDAGNLALDANAAETLVIPPNYEAFVSQSHCSSECFSTVRAFKIYGKGSWGDSW